MPFSLILSGLHREMGRRNHAFLHLQLAPGFLLSSGEIQARERAPLHVGKPKAAKAEPLLRTRSSEEPEES